MLWPLQCSVEVWWWLAELFSSVCQGEALLGMGVTVKGSCLQLLKSHLTVGTLLITSVEELLDYLDLPRNEAMTSWVVRTAYSHSESPLFSKFLVVFAGKLGTTVTDDFFWSAKYWKRETWGRNHFLRTNARHFLYIRKFTIVLSNPKVVFITLDKYIHT